MSDLSAKDAAPVSIAASPQPPTPVVAFAAWDRIIDALQQRDLLAPILLLCAPYVALPVFVKPLLLLVTPIVELLGLPIGGVPIKIDSSPRTDLIYAEQQPNRAGEKTREEKTREEKTREEKTKEEETA